METPYYQSMVFDNSKSRITTQNKGKRKSMQDIHAELEQRLGGISIPTLAESSTMQEEDASESSITIRIEQPIAHTVDPLCWLHANIPKVSSLSPTTTTQASTTPSSSWDYANPEYTQDDPPTLFFANAEESVETSVFGSARTIHNLNMIPPEDQEVDGVDNPDEYNIGDAEWKWIKSLPSGSRMYGGGRFDMHPGYQVGEEWRDFPSNIWLLPAIELKREHIPLYDSDAMDASESNDDTVYEDELHKEKDSQSMIQTTFAIHLDFSDIESLFASTRHTLQLLQAVSYATSPPIPTTTLPPILSRQYNKDAQEVFERGVTTALEKMTNDKEESTSTLEKRDFQKVVLARRADLQFGTDVSGLDILMKIKFGGNVGGHLFFINIGQRVGKEFLGCSPERLFQVQSRDRRVSKEMMGNQYAQHTVVLMFINTNVSI